MTPSARVQAAIELLDDVIAAAKSDGAPADRIIANYFKQRRYAGSKDRRAVRELVYQAIRTCGEIPISGRAAMLALAEQDLALTSLFDGSKHGPEPIAEGEAHAAIGVAPGWLVDRLERSSVNRAAQSALLARAPLDCRINTLKADRAALELPEAGEHLVAPQGLRFEAGTPVEQWDAYRSGQIEVQDHGSQLVCLAADAKPGETVIDLCAGAGGKTLALAAAMQNTGQLIACDTDRARLSRLGPRAERAGVTMVETRLLDPKREGEAIQDFVGAADMVMVDAPCSGTGTWRRKPEAKWRLSPARLDRFAQLQDHLLETAVGFVRPGGRIVYVTCSLLDDEGTDRIDRFLSNHPQFSAQMVDLPVGRPHGHGYRLEPFQDGTDGFFIAILHSS
jgi:16S rRNA (cytosine967-C5)-methyltransferase